MPSDYSFTAREALRTPAFWVISVGHAFALLVMSVVGQLGGRHLAEGGGYRRAFHRAATAWVLIAVFEVRRGALTLFFSLQARVLREDPYNHGLMAAWRQGWLCFGNVKCRLSCIGATLADGD